MQRCGWLAILAFLGVFGATTVQAQNLDEGKTAPQLFAGDCAACHKGPQGLGKNATVGFLRQHYTSSARSAALLSAYLASVGSGPARADRQKAGQGDQKESREERAQRKREKTAVARPPDAERKNSRKTRRNGTPEPGAADPAKTPSSPTPTASTPAEGPGEAATAAAPPYPPPLTMDPPTASGETPVSRPEAPETAAVAAAPVAAAPPAQPVFGAPLP